MVFVGPEGSCRPCPKIAAQAIVTDEISAMQQDDHTLHAFLASAAINNASEQGRQHLVCMRDSVQGQSAPSDFTLRTLIPLPHQPSIHLEQCVRVFTASG